MAANKRPEKPYTHRVIGYHQNGDEEVSDHSNKDTAVITADLFAKRPSTYALVHDLYGFIVHDTRNP